MIDDDNIPIKHICIVNISKINGSIYLLCVNLRYIQINKDK